MSEIKETFSPWKAEEAQKEYCKAHDAPEFFPNHYVGFMCYRCHRNIFSPGGYSVEFASNHLITGCPFCHASYCD